MYWQVMIDDIIKRDIFMVCSFRVLINIRGSKVCFLTDIAQTPPMTINFREFNIRKYSAIQYFYSLQKLK